MLDKIGIKPPAAKKTAWKDKCSMTVNGLEPHTFDFICSEAMARNMSNSEFLKEICERLESGEF